MPLFSVNINNVIWWRLPQRWRNPIMFAWLKALCAPVAYIYNLFLAYQASSVYYLSHNSQVCYMEAALNDTFDAALRRIYITDGADEYPWYVYTDAEATPVYMGLDSEVGSEAYAPVYIYLDDETALEEGSGFIVHVPVATLNAPYMTALIEKYRLPGRNIYAIVTF